jgi:hypothetical protein
MIQLILNILVNYKIDKYTLAASFDCFKLYLWILVRPKKTLLFDWLIKKPFQSVCIYKNNFYDYLGL